MTAPADLTVRTVRGVWVASIGVDVDTSSADRLEAAIRQRTSADSTLVVDLCGVSFLDSAGVRMLDRLVGRHAGLVIVAPRDAAPRYSLDVCAFPAALLADTLESALTRLEPAGAAGAGDPEIPGTG